MNKLGVSGDYLLRKCWATRMWEFTNLVTIKFFAHFIRLHQKNETGHSYSSSAGD
jgi:hypothetical protein